MQKAKQSVEPLTVVGVHFHPFALPDNSVFFAVKGGMFPNYERVVIAFLFLASLATSLFERARVCCLFFVVDVIVSKSAYVCVFVASICILQVMKSFVGPYLQSHRSFVLSLSEWKYLLTDSADAVLSIKYRVSLVATCFSAVVFVVLFVFFTQEFAIGAMDSQQYFALASSDLLLFLVLVRLFLH